MMNYEPAKIRHFLQERFNDEELNHLCFDYFPAVNNDFTGGMRKSQKVQMLLEHCQKQGRWPALMAALERERPEAFLAQFSTVPQIESTRQPYAPVQRNPRQVFISHAHQDAEFAHRLAADLKMRGWQIWIAPDNIRPGEKWVEAINRGLEESGVFLLVLTPDAVNSYWVRDETNVAIELKREGKLRLLPLLVKPCDVPPLWRLYQRIPFQDDYRAGLQALMTELQPETMNHLAQLYEQLQTAMNAEKWRQAQNLGGQIEAQYPDYKDVTSLLTQAEEGLERQEEREKELGLLYQQLHKVLEKKNWDAAKTIGQKIQGIDQDYRDVVQLLDQVNESLRRQEQKEQLASYYRQLEEAVNAEEWDTALEIGRRIQAKEYDYRDVNQILAQAHEVVQQKERKAHAKQTKPPFAEPTQATSSQIRSISGAKTSEARSSSLLAPFSWTSLPHIVPVWGWIVLIVTVIGFSVWGFGQFGAGDATAITPTPEETNLGSTEVASLIQTRTPMPNSTPTNTVTLRPTEPSPTNTPTFTLSPQPTDTPTRTPRPTSTARNTPTRTPTPTNVATSLPTQTNVPAPMVLTSDEQAAIGSKYYTPYVDNPRVCMPPESGSIEIGFITSDLMQIYNPNWADRVNGEWQRVASNQWQIEIPIQGTSLGSIETIIFRSDGFDLKSESTNPATPPDFGPCYYRFFR